ncbi:hypothetical protein FDUTEX481_04029 [Tolypothrix sp. PCC 7601]|nr:hypothetical protein FDUTEX481_04029 [Tolypothrix sp. PCC 7601]
MPYLSVNTVQLRKLIDNKTKKLVTQQKNRTIILEGVWGTQPSPNRGFGGFSPN